MQFPCDIPLFTLLFLIFIPFGHLLTLQVGGLQNSERIRSFAFLHHDVSARITPYLVNPLRFAGCQKTWEGGTIVGFRKD